MAAVSKAQQKRDEQAEAKAGLREVLVGIETIYTVQTYRGRDGMTRSIKPLIAKGDEILDLTWRVARAGFARFDDKHGGVRLGGWGMDFGFHLVYSIGHMVTGDEPWQCRGDRCPSNVHVNDYHAPRGAQVMHTEDSGYRFNHVWL